MKKLYLVALASLLFVTGGFAQVTVTNPTNTTPALASTYTSLANAVTALNSITGISGQVIITLDPGNPQTAPAGGYAIFFAANTTATNNIIFSGNNNIITASASHTVGNLSDGIFRLVGADYVTIQNFVMQENPANTVNTPATSNTMTEWGVALLRVGTTDGSQNNTIQNNTISLNKAYRNTFGIYSNARHVANTPTAALEATAFSGSNSGNKVYGNNISNVMMGITFIGPGVQAYHDTGNDIGGSSVATGNTITNWGGNTQLSNYAHNSVSSYCILMQQQVFDNVSYNTINSGTVGAGVSTTFSGILKEFPGGPPLGTYTSYITYNTITLASAFSGGNMECIRTNTSNSSTVTINITNNNIVNCSINTVGTTSPFFGIYNTSAPGILNISNNVIRGLTTVSTGNITAISNTNPISNTINITNNKIGDAVAGAVTNTTGASGSIFGISNTGASATATLNINNNTLDGFSFVTSGVVNFLHNTSGFPAAVNINDNLLGSTTGSLVTYSAAQPSIVNGINNTAGNAAMLLSIQNNDFTGVNYAVAGNASCQLLLSQASAQSVLIHNNTFTNLVLNTTGAIRFISKSGVMASGATSVVSNNRIVGNFSKPAAGNTTYMYVSSGASVTGSSSTVTGNNFSNINLSGNTSFYGIYDSEGSAVSGSPVKVVSGNTVSNVTAGSGSVFCFYMIYGEGFTVSSNTVSNVTGSAQVSGINFTNIAAGPLEATGNTISSLSGATFFTYGLSFDAAQATSINIHGNNISGLTNGTANTNVAGIFLSTGQTPNIYNNTITDLTHTGGGTSVIHGIWLNGGTTANIYRNVMYSFQHSGAASATSPAVMGINISNGTTVTAYNNFVAALNASNADLADAVRGISVTGTNTLTNYNLYFNSIYLNCSSTGTNFGTSGIYHTGNLSPTTGTLRMNNNIVVNTSTANGTGVTAALRRSGTELDNYSSTSDHNLWYAGTPSATRLIFYDGTNSDQTLAAYKTRMATRDENSISLMPAFVSATNLHLTAANCMIDGRGFPVAGITDDIDLDTRNTTKPDIGADEFSAAANTTLAGVSGAAVCEDRTVEVTGTTYRNNTCDLIARVVPSGGDPVAGNINVCVTVDATQQYFNGEPYVQRHYDLEPVTSNQTTTSATITLYFTNAEFVQYNTNNPVWPDLPTIAGGGNADPNIANVKVTQFHGTPTGGLPTSTPGNYTGAWALLTPVSVVLNGTVWEVTVNISGFSGFYVHTNMWNAPLPVNVNYFTGVKQGGQHLLNWKVTCNNTPRVIMQLERSADSRNFIGVNSITADAARCSEPFNYTDVLPLSGMNYYRLKMSDADGKIYYSNIVALLNAAKGFEIISIAPNPVVNGNFKLNVSSAQASGMDISIFDMQGRLVNRQAMAVIAGFNNLTINAANLAPGTYSIQAIIAGERSKPVRFIKQ